MNANLHSNDGSKDKHYPGNEFGGYTDRNDIQNE